MIALNDVPRRCAGVAHEIEATGESAIFDEAGGKLLVLNDLGAAVWYLIDGARTAGQIVEVIAQHISVEHARLSADVLRFLGTLEEARLVQRWSSAVDS